MALVIISEDTDTDTPRCPGTSRVGQAGDGNSDPPAIFMWRIRYLLERELSKPDKYSSRPAGWAGLHMKMMYLSEIGQFQGQDHFISQGGDRAKSRIEEVHQFIFRILDFCLTQI